MKRTKDIMKGSLDYGLCIICQTTSLETVQRVTAQGYPAILSAAISKFDEVTNLLKMDIHNQEQFLSKNPVCHARCRRAYTRVHYQQEADVKKPKLHTRHKSFTVVQNTCFICQKDRDKKGNRKLTLIATQTRQNDVWRKAKELEDTKMLTLLEGFGDTCVDMIAKDFKYHGLCITTYLSKKGPAEKSRKSTVRAIDFYPFDDIHKILFEDKKGVRVSWVREKIHACAALVNTTYNTTYPRTADIVKTLKNKFGETIVTLPYRGGFSNVVFATNVVMERMEKYIVHDKSDSDCEQETDSDAQYIPVSPTSPHKSHSNIFHTATVIRSDIECARNELELGENIVTMSKDVAQKIIPPRLFNFMHFLLHHDEADFDSDNRVVVKNKSEENEVLSVCQDILLLSGIRTPKSVGLALLLMKQRNKFLIEKLNQLGHCVSYSDAQRFLNDFAVKVSDEIGDKGVFIPVNIKKDTFTHFAMDNLDFQEKSKDGQTTHGTTHIIFQHNGPPEEDTSYEISLRHKNKRIVPRNIDFSPIVLTKIDRERSRSLKEVPLTFSSECNNREITCVWNLYSMLSDSLDDFATLSWSAFFESLSTKPLEGSTIIGYGPFVPESPTKPGVVQNSVDYFIAVASKLNQQYVIITADQAIYEIILALKSKYPRKYETVILRMGGFHIILNYLGAIGHLMSSSGIEELLTSAHVLMEGTAKKVVSGGKDYYQMVRCHSLIYSAFFDLYWECFIKWIESEENTLNSEDTEKLWSLLAEIKILQGHMSSTENTDEYLIAFSNASFFLFEIRTLRKIFEKSFEDNPTAKLWLMYMDMVAIAQWYIHSERSGCWEDHLSSVESMLPYLVAAGHYKYVSCIPHYLKCMKDLKLKVPSVWKEFERGKFTIHLKSGSFNGVWSDMALEQTFNKDCKNQLLTGISMERDTTDRYLYALPILSSLSDHFLRMFQRNVKSSRHSHHFDSGAFAEKNLTDRENIKNIIRQKINPFTFQTNDLLNVFSGHKCKSTDLCDARTIGLNVLKEAERSSTEKIPRLKIQLFSDSEKVKSPLENRSKLFEDESMVLRSLYFARELDEIQKVDVFSHEWLNYPPSLSYPDTGNLFGYRMRKGNKADFFQAMKAHLKDRWIEVNELGAEPNQTIVYIIDMMAFIQRHQTKNCRTFIELFRKYVEIILGTKPTECELVVLVGDRYEPSIKDVERIRRTTSTKTNQEFEVQDHIEIPNWKNFLSNNKNKARLLTFISDKICEEHCSLPTNVTIIATGMAEEIGSTTVSSVSESKILTNLHFTEHSEADTRIFAIVQYLTNQNYSNFVVEATDTDIFVLALYYVPRMKLSQFWIHRCGVYIPVHHAIMELSTAKSKAASDVGNLLLGIYVLTGCDTVSFFFRKGKTVAFKQCLKYLNDPQLQPLLEYPSNNCFNVTDFENAARYFLKILYGRPDFIGNLDCLRAHLFHSCKSDIRNLPPTEDAFHNHVLRVAYQVLVWKTASVVHPMLPDPVDFGWLLKDSIWIPKLITVSSRPNPLRESVFCKCKKVSSCIGNCSCAKVGLPCIIGCYCEGRCRSFS